MKINQTLFFITLILALAMVESGKTNTNSQGYKRYQRSKAQAEAKKAAQPLPETLEEKENVASRAFHACTKNEWKGVRSTLPAVQQLISQGHINNAPADSSLFTKENCKMAGAKGKSDLSEGVNTFRFAYTSAEHKRAYFPIVTTGFSNYSLLRTRTLSAQENPLLTGKHVEEPVHDVSTDVETQDESVVEEPVDEDLAELERLAILAEAGKPIINHEEPTEETVDHDNLKDLEELEKMAAQAELEKEEYHPYMDYNHIQKHETTQDDEEDFYGFNHLYNQHNDINDHVNFYDEAEEEEERRPLLGQDNHDVQLMEPTEEEIEERMNNIVPLFNDIEDSVEQKSPVHEENMIEEETPVKEEKTTFHDPEHEEYNFFDRKNNKDAQLNRVNHLEEQEEKHTTHKQLLGGFSEPKACEDQEKHNTLAYITKMTLSGKMLGLVPTTQNMMSCSHQIVAGTNYSVIIQINNDICEAVYTVDIENIIHDLDKSYAKREVPCVDMYARHLF